MKRKILLLLILLFVLSGCEATYTLEINNDDYIEIMEINNYSKNLWDTGDISYRSLINTNAKSKIATDYREEMPESNEIKENVSYYDIIKYETSDNLGLRYDHTFNYETYKYSSLVYMNNSAFMMKEYDNTIKINNKKNDIFLKYKNLTKLTVVFKTNHTVLTHNADEVTDNTYYWVIDRSNYQKKEIELEISSNAKINQKIFTPDENGYFGANTLIIIYLGVGILVVIAFIYILIKIKKSNN